MRGLRISVLSVVFICAGIFAQSARAQEGGNIRPYGNLYVFFGYVQQKLYDEGQKQETDKDTIYRIDDDSNLGFNFSYAKYSGVFELGISDYEEGRDVRIRKAYGTYSFGSNKLTIGQDWNPYVRWSHETADYYRSERFGALYEEPTTQLKITRSILSELKIYIDVIKPYVPTDNFYSEQQVDNPTAATDATNTEYKIEEVEREITTKLPLENIQAMVPKTVIGCEYETKVIKAELGAAGSGYKIKKTEEVEYNKDWIMSYLFYLYTHFRYRDLTVDLNGGFSINPANFGIAVQSKGNTSYHGGAAAAVYNIATNEYEIKDTWNAQGYIEFGYEITGSTIIHVGAGYSRVDYPMENTVPDDAYELYANVKFNIGGLIALTPSISYHDYMEDMVDVSEADEDSHGNDEGSDFYAGILATVSFY